LAAARHDDLANADDVLVFSCYGANVSDS
jgi:hypothetical protein